MFYLVRAHGSINSEPFVVPEGYGFITLAESGVGRKSAENDFLFGVISKSLYQINKCNNDMEKITGSDEIEAIKNKKRTFTFLLKSLLLPSSNRTIKYLLNLIETKLTQDGNLDDLKSRRSRQKDIDLNNFIDFVKGCFQELGLVNSCTTNEEKLRLIIRWKENIDYIKYYSPGSVMSNTNFSFHGIYHYSDHEDFSNNKVSIKKSGIISVSDLVDKKNKYIKYRVPRFSLRSKDEFDTSLGFNYFYIDSSGKLKEFKEIIMNENYSYDALISICDAIKINPDAIRTIQDKFDDSLGVDYIQKLICKDVLFLYNFNRMLYKTSDSLNQVIDRNLTEGIKNISIEYKKYYKKNLKKKENITPQDLKDAARFLYDLEKRYAFLSYKELVRVNINTLVNPESGRPIFKKGIYIITSCRVGEPTEETYYTNDSIFVNNWTRLIESL